MKILSLIIFAFLLYPSMIFAWDGKDSYGTYVLPTSIIDYCELEKEIIDDKIKTQEAITECLTKIEDERATADYDKKNILNEMSAKSLQDFNINLIAYAAKSKKAAATFRTSPQEEEAIKGSTEDGEDLKVRINNLVLILSDNSRLFSDTMQRVADRLSAQTYRDFHQTSVVNALTKSKVLEERQ